MRRCNLIFGAIFFFSVLLTDASFSADAVKIGIIDFQRILDTSSAGKSARAEITKQGQEMEDELKKKGAEIEKQKQQFEQEALVMNKDLRDQKERELRINIGDLKALQQKYNQDFKNFEFKLVDRMQKETLEIVNSIGKKDGYLLILEKRESGVLYAPPTIDITDQIIKEYNSSFAKTKNPDSKAQKR